MEIANTDTQEAILMRHLQIGGNIFRLISIGKWLVKQFRQKKALKEKDGTFSFQDNVTRKYLEEYLLQGKKGELHQFPKLRASLEKRLQQELGSIKKSTLMDIYYNHEGKPKHLRFDQFSEYDWWLSKGPEMSADDVSVMEKYRELLVRILTESASECKESKKVRKEREKCLKLIEGKKREKKNC